MACQTSPRPPRRQTTPATATTPAATALCRCPGSGHEYRARRGRSRAVKKKDVDPRPRLQQHRRLAARIQDRVLRVASRCSSSASSGGSARTWRACTGRYPTGWFIADNADDACVEAVTPLYLADWGVGSTQRILSSAPGVRDSRPDRALHQIVELIPLPLHKVERGHCRSTQRFIAWTTRMNRCAGSDPALPCGVGVE